ncbi:MAG: hypothetical protein PQJ47_07235 [Sphaerochaetaceae bacterium]|nr:hypothetical protein [Sphaerochaetaceae bacterium]
MSIFEALMLLAFGCAWPASIYTSLTSKSTEGKSLPFLIIIALGYVSGITHKILYSLDFVILLYTLNLLMVLFDLLLYARNRKREKAALR